MVDWDGVVSAFGAGEDDEISAEWAQTVRWINIGGHAFSLDEVMDGLMDAGYTYVRLELGLPEDGPQ